MANKKKSKLNNALQIILIVLCFIFVFFMKALNNIEAKGYFMKDETTDEIRQIIVKKIYDLNSIDNKFIYEMDGGYYRLGEDGLPEYVDIVLVDTQPTKYDNIESGKLYVVKCEFFSVSNLKETISDVKYWALSIALSIALTVSYGAAFSIKKTNLLIGEEYTNKQAEYVNKIKLKPLNFSKYIREDNLIEKKRVYKEKIMSKLALLQCILDRIEDTGSKKYNKIKKQIEFNNRIITDEYIDKHIEGLNVKYYALHADNFRNSDVDVNISGRKDRSEENKIMSKVYIKKEFKSIFISLIFAALVLSFYINFALDGELWIIILSSALGMLTSIVNGSRQAVVIYKNEYYGVICNKISIIEDSIKWAINNPTEEKGFEEIIQNYIRNWQDTKTVKKE